ncbi:MAG: hypothetical protein CL827_08610 [Crocinitomicaceae bacterium]|nr:hypothetical protein [Crocinitomicaceae bacterium]
MLKFFLSGFFLLFFAIIINAIIQYFNIMNWYGFLMILKTKSWPSKITFIDYFWLFIGYPLSLGAIIYFTSKIFF